MSSFTPGSGPDEKVAAITLVIEGPDTYGRVLIPRDAGEVHIYAHGANGLEVRIDGGEDESGADE